MFNNLNLFGWKFKGDKSQEQPLQDKAPYVQAVSEDAAYTVGTGYFGHNSYQLNLNETFNSEAELIRKYREVAIQPEPDTAITEIVNEAISGDDDGQVVRIILDNVKQSESIKKRIADEFSTILRLLDFNRNSYELFRGWYVDARLYHHIIIDQKAPSRGILELRRLSPLQIRKVREELKEVGPGGVEIVKQVDEYYMYNRDYLKNTYSGIKLTLDSVSFIHSGLLDEQSNTIYGYIHKALKSANQIRMVEDASVIYRLSRASERRMFYIDVGNMPPNKAIEYVKQIQAGYANKIVYDAATGEIKDSKLTLSLMDDFWIPRFEGNKSTEIDTLDGGDNLDKIADIEYFRRKLYESLNVPIGRLTGEQSGSLFGSESEVSRDEQRFAKFVSRLRKRFSGLFYDLLRTQLLLKGIITAEDWEQIKEEISFDYLKSSAAKEKEDMALLQQQVSMIKDMEPMVGLFFSKRMIQKKVLRMSDFEIEQMNKEIEDERKAGDLDLFSAIKQDMALDMPIEDTPENTGKT